MLTCDFKFCIYQEDGRCILDSIDISDCGMCDSVIVLDLPEDKLALIKKKQLLAMENR